LRWVNVVISIESRCCVTSKVLVLGSKSSSEVELISHDRSDATSRVSCGDAYSIACIVECLSVTAVSLSRSVDNKVACLVGGVGVNVPLGSAGTTVEELDKWSG